VFLIAASGSSERSVANDRAESLRIIEEMRRKRAFSHALDPFLIEDDVDPAATGACVRKLTAVFPVVGLH
jgi:hypothetical protein